MFKVTLQKASQLILTDDAMEPNADKIISGIQEAIQKRRGPVCGQA